MFRDRRSVSWSVIALFAVVHIVWSVLANLGFRANVPLLNTLTANLIGILVIVLGVMFVLGGLRPRDVGLRKSQLAGAAIFTLLLWGLTQLAVLGFAGLAGDEIGIHNHWASMGIGLLLFSLTGQLFGNALYEEIAFRGFLLPQLYHKFRHWGHALSLGVALGLSQLMFALVHIPNRIWSMGLALENLTGDLLMLLVMGIGFAVLYLLTDNLLAVVGAHTLNNIPMLMLGSGEGGAWMPTAMAMWTVALVLASIWYAYRRKMRSRTWHARPDSLQLSLLP